MTWWLLALVGLFAFFGSAVQRVTGLGFALVASPLLVLALGGTLGVQVTQAVGIVGSAVVLAQLWRDVEWAKAALLFLPALAGVVPGAVVARALPAPVLSILIGLMVIVALSAMVASERAHVFKGVPGLIGAGFLSGFMNVTAGIGGPAVVLYALSTKWRHEAFVATLQLYFVALSAASLAALGIPDVAPVTWVVGIGSLLLGVWVGSRLVRRVNPDAARRLMLAVAFAGAAATVVKGVLGLL